MALPTIGNNQPSAGSISWTAFGLQYDGVSYELPAGNTNQKFVWWDYEGSSTGTIAPSANFITDPDFATGADNLVSLTPNASDPAGTDSPTPTYGRITGNDNFTQNLVLRTIPGHTYRFSVTAKAASGNTSGTGFGLMVWRRTTDGYASNTYAGNNWVGGTASNLSTWKTITWNWVAPADDSWHTVRPSLRAGGSQWLVTQFSVTDISSRIVAGNTLPDLTPDDCLLFLNRNGLGILAPTAQVVDGSLIVAGTIVGDALAANIIDAHHIKAGAIEANAIAAGAVTTPALAAGAVTTNKLSVATISDSLIANGSFEDGVQGWEVIQGGAGYVADIVTGVSSSGAYALRLTRNSVVAEENDVIVGTSSQFFIPVSATNDRRWYVSSKVGASSALPSGYSLSVYYYKADKTPSVEREYDSVITDQPLDTSWVVYEGQVTPPSDAAYAQVVVSNVRPGATIYVDEVVMYEVVVSAMIGDGAIQTPHLQAGSVTADIIAGGTITSEHIASESITGDKIVAGTLNANHLSPSIGNQLDLSANDAIVIQAGRTDDLEDALDGTNEQLQTLQTSFSITADGASVTKSGSIYRVLIKDNSVEIQRNGVPVSIWTEAGLEVQSFVGKNVILANHKVETYGAGTVVKAV